MKEVIPMRWILMLVMVLVGCAGLDAPQPRNFQEASVYAVNMLLGLRQTLAQAQQTGSLPEPLIQQLNDRLDKARETIKQARSLWSGGSNTLASTQLDAAMALLAAIRKEVDDYGRSRGTGAGAQGDGHGAAAGWRGGQLVWSSA